MSTSTRQATVTFQPVGRRLDVTPGSTVLEAAHSAGIEISSECGGVSRCGQCLVRLGAGVLSPPTSDELELMTDEEVAGGYRLACAAVVGDDITLFVPEAAKRGDQRLQLDGESTIMVLDHEGEVGSYGLAVDIGTTKIAAYLMDMGTGEELAQRGIMNPQIHFGEDIISRLGYARRNQRSREELTTCIRDVLDVLLGELVERATIDREQVVSACIVGNTAMTHLFAGLPIDQLAVAPFAPAVDTSIEREAQAMGFQMAENAVVQVLPCIGGFVGADHVAMLLAAGMDDPKELSLGVDIGTNTEISISVPGASGISSASCASGPAFEGAHIRDGMRASPGAIEAVALSDDGVEVRTIGDVPPIGLCGSGVVDAVAELWRRGLVNRSGRFHRDAPGVQDGDGGRHFVLIPAERSGSGRDIVIAQSDIGEIQMAKGAILAGIETLMDVTDTPLEAIERVVVAGAFGSYLDHESAKRIGLIPRFPAARVDHMGNAAGVGAKMALLSSAARERASHLAEKAVHIEIERDSGFRRRFAEAMRFPIIST